MKIKTSELTGAALDWAVAKCEGQALLDPDNNEWEYCWNLLGDNSGEYYSPSTDWAQGGPIIERERLQITSEKLGEWVASTPHAVEQGGFRKYCFNNGTTPLIAAMRCDVAFKLGDEVEIPNGLLP